MLVAHGYRNNHLVKKVYTGNADQTKFTFVVVIAAIFVQKCFGFREEELKVLRRNLLLWVYYITLHILYIIDYSQ